MLIKLTNPHYAGAALLSRIAVNFATGLWALQVLLVKDALNVARYPIYATALEYLPEDIYAAGALLLVSVAVWRIVSCARPRFIGAVGYGLLAMFWVYIAISLYTFSPLPGPATIATVTTVAVLALLAFASNPMIPDGAHK